MNTRNIRFRSNRVRDIHTLYHEELDGIYGAGEVRVFLDMLFEAFLGWDKVRLLTSKEQTIDQSDLLRFHWALEDLKQYRPIQHIIGYTDFCDCRIDVSPDVLIPRTETEEIVNWIIKNFTFGSTGSPTTVHLSPFTILDLCTGSGCIAIALKKSFPQAAVTAVDISDKALALAKQNAEHNATDITFLHADVLDPQFSIFLPESKGGTACDRSGANFQFSIIISNPPYVRESERAQINRNVLDYDPDLALFVPDDDPLRFYRAIATIAKKHLTKDGLVVVEINEAYADETCELLRKKGFQPEVHIDFRGKSRWITAKYK